MRCCLFIHCFSATSCLVLETTKVYQETFEVSGDLCRDLRFPVDYAEYWAREKSRGSALLGQYEAVFLP